MLIKIRIANPTVMAFMVREIISLKVTVSVSYGVFEDLLLNIKTNVLYDKNFI